MPKGKNIYSKDKKIIRNKVIIWHKCNYIQNIKNSYDSIVKGPKEKKKKRDNVQGKMCNISRNMETPGKNQKQVLSKAL